MPSAESQSLEDRIAEAVLAKLRPILAPKQRSAIEPELLTRQDAAAFLGISENGLATLVAKEEIHPTMLDSKPRFSRAQLARLIERKTG